jgi:CBS domain containing-hemolysin-like protein
LYKDDALISLTKKDTEATLKKIAREAIFIPESMFADELMREFQSKHIHMAVVVNEYGEVVGIATLEDIIEELVGEIVDETDVSERPIKEIDKRTISVSGVTEVQYINNFFDVSLDEKYVTINGLIQDKLNRIPKKGEKLKLENVTLEIKDADKTKVKKVIITKKQLKGIL